MLTIGYLSEADADYARALTTADTLEGLRALVTKYAELAVDAVPVTAAMTEADFRDFRKGLKSERRGKFAGDTWAARFGAILMPLPMMKITEIATRYGCPFGVAYHRLKELRPDILKIGVERTGAPSKPVLSGRHAPKSLSLNK